MACKQATKKGEVPKGKHYQILVFGTYDYTVDYGPPDRPYTDSRPKVDLFVTEDENAWRAELTRLYQHNPQRTDVLAQIVDRTADVSIGVQIG